MAEEYQNKKVLVSEPQLVKPVASKKVMILSQTGSAAVPIQPKFADSSDRQMENEETEDLSDP